MKRKQGKPAGTVATLPGDKGPVHVIPKKGETPQHAVARVQKAHPGGKTRRVK